MRALAFELARLWFKLRDIFSPPADVLSEVGIETGFRVLDYGCGPGSYSIAAAEMVGPSGKVYAADIDPRAIKHVRGAISRKEVGNVETIQTDCATGLEDGSVDVVLLYDTYHDLEDPDGVLMELHRVLKPDAVLSFSDHHLSEDEILNGMTGDGLFRLRNKGQKTYSFVKA